MFDIRSLIKEFFDDETDKEILFLKGSGKFELSKRDIQFYKDYYLRDVRKAREERWQQAKKLK